MKKFTKFGAVMLAIASVVAMASCNKSTSESDEVFDDSGYYEKEQFLAYADGLAYELDVTATALYEAWWKPETLQYTYTTLADIIDGMETIADEVGGEKIETPYVDKDVYGVESWYSFNSFTDYRDNIYSIQNVFYGKLLTSTSAADRATMAVTDAAEKSLANTDSNAAALNTAINAALVALNNLIDEGTPFRDYVLDYRDNGTDSSAIRDLISLVGDVTDACGDLSTTNTDSDDIISNVVNNVIIPTYASLATEATSLKTKMTAFKGDATQTNLDAVATQWKATRQPWEQSEAFLFGPVDTEGYDPHLDSWPLSQSLINSLLSIGLLYDDNGETNYDAFSTSLRDEVLGFHALEYVIFKSGEVRVVADLFGTELDDEGEEYDVVYIEGTNEM